MGAGALLNPSGARRCRPLDIADIRALQSCQLLPRAFSHATISAALTRRQLSRSMFFVPATNVSVFNETTSGGCEAALGGLSSE
jgi:hypothetical protein